MLTRLLAKLRAWLARRADVRARKQRIRRTIAADRALQATRARYDQQHGAGITWLPGTGTPSPENAPLAAQNNDSAAPGPTPVHIAYDHNDEENAA